MKISTLESTETNKNNLNHFTTNATNQGRLPVNLTVSSNFINYCHPL